MTGSDNTTDTPAQRNRERWVLFAAVVTTGMSFIDATALNVVLPELQTELNATGTELLWVVNAYGLPLAALLLVAGAIGDRYGRKCVYMTGIAWFAFSSLACGFAPGIQTLIAVRGLQGIGAALMVPGSLAMITATVPRSRRGKAIGVWSACSVVTTAFGPLVGGLFARAGWWQGIFLINLPLAGIALATLSVTATESRAQSRGPVDVRGACWSVCGLAAINLGLIEAASRGWHDRVVWGGLLLGSVSLIMFVHSEKRAKQPVLPLDLFQIKSLKTVCIVTLLFYSSLYGMTLFLSLNLIQLQAYNAVSAGLALLPIMLLVAIISPWTGRIMDRSGGKHLLTIGPAIAGLGYLGLALPGITSGPPAYWIWFLPPLLLLGFGMSMTAVPLTAAIMNSVPSQHSGLASGLNSTLSRLSSVLGVAILGPVALFAFTHSLSASTAPLSLTNVQRSALIREAAAFGAARPPADSSPTLHTEITRVLRSSFLKAFRTVSCVCAGASWLGALIAATTLNSCPFRSDADAAD